MQQNPNRGQELIAAAFTWRFEGVSVVPAQPRSKAVLYHWRRLESSPPSENDIRHWFKSGVMNMAVVCGSGGLLVLDFDKRDQFEAWKEKAGPELADTYTERSARGVHVFYKTDQTETRRFLECEALGVGHLCLVYPSIHPTGALYFSDDPGAPIRFVPSKQIFALLSDPPTPAFHQLPGGSLRKDGSPAAIGGGAAAKIKAAMPLLSYVNTLTAVKPSGGGGRFLIGRCPLHKDREPSFYVDTKLNLWRCYSPQCKGHDGGDVITLYAWVHDVSIPEAIRQLAKEVL